jgi:hypothetical protein
MHRFSSLGCCLLALVGWLLFVGGVDGVGVGCCCWWLLCIGVVLVLVGGVVFGVVCVLEDGVVCGVGVLVLYVRCGWLVGWWCLFVVGWLVCGCVCVLVLAVVCVGVVVC